MSLEKNLIPDPTDTDDGFPYRGPIKSTDVFGPPPNHRPYRPQPEVDLPTLMQDLKTVQAKRYNDGKPKLSYFRRSFHKALEAVARIKEFGAAKYEDGNWRAGGKPDAEYLDSMDRHLDLWLQGETYDQDSGCHHLGHAIWNLCALYELNHNEEPAIDEELFRQRINYWLEKKQNAESTETGSSA